MSWFLWRKMTVGIMKQVSSLLCSWRQYRFLHMTASSSYDQTGSHDKETPHFLKFPWLITLTGNFYGLDRFYFCRRFPKKRAEIFRKDRLLVEKFFCFALFTSTSTWAGGKQSKQSYITSAVVYHLLYKKVFKANPKFHSKEQFFNSGRCLPPP